MPFSGVEFFFSHLLVTIFRLAEFLGFLSFGACAVRGQEEERFEDEFLKTIFRRAYSEP